MQRELVERAMAGDQDAFRSSARLDRPALRRRPVDRPRRQRRRGCDTGGARRRLVALLSPCDPDRFEAWLHRLLVRACYREAGRHRRRGAWRSACRSSSRPSQMTARPWPTAISSSRLSPSRHWSAGHSRPSSLPWPVARRDGRSRCRARHGPVATSPGHPRDARRARRGRPVFSRTKGGRHDPARPVHGPGPGGVRPPSRSLVRG